MKIHSPSKVLLLPVLFIALGIYYYSENIGTRDDTIWFFVPALMLVLIYLFGPQIDYWWHKKHPIPLDVRIKKWLEEYLSYYNKFDTATKKLFDYRLGLYIEAREFKSVGSEIREVPEDIKGSIASIPIRLSLNDKDFLLGDYDRIYVYSHPFPSPKMPFLHTLEIDHEDGLFLFSLEQLLPGIIHPDKYFPIGLYAFLEVYFRLKTFSPGNNISWQDIDNSELYTRDQIAQTSGRQDLNPALVAAIIYFVKPEYVYANHRTFYDRLDHFFHKTPCDTVIR